MTDLRFRDGNAAAGDLLQVFGIDVTSAMGVCMECQHRAAVGEMTAYTDAPGVVLRCPVCTTVLLRIATTAESCWLHMPGLRSLEIPVQP